MRDGTTFEGITAFAYGAAELELLVRDGTTFEDITAFAHGAAELDLLAARAMTLTQVFCVPNNGLRTECRLCRSTNCVSKHG